MKHKKWEPSQTSLRVKHAELLADIELIATRANAARKVPQKAAAGIVEAAEVAHIRVMAAAREARGGKVNNDFFYPLSARLRRIIKAYRKFSNGPAKEPSAGRWVYQIMSYEALPFDRLKPYFRASHVEEAIKTGIGLGLREIPGLRIYEDLEPTE